MKKKVVLLLFLSLSFVMGMADGYFSAMHSSHRPFDFGRILPGSILIFLWVYYDSAERNYRRPRWLSTGVVAIGFVFVPIYLLKSRAKGTKAAALGGYALVALLYLLLYVAGVFCGALIHG
jgi:hypothetical protein